jgi:hypothetical protein
VFGLAEEVLRFGAMPQVLGCWQGWHKDRGQIEVADSFAEMVAVSGLQEDQQDRLLDSQQPLEHSVAAAEADKSLEASAA